ncbi:hypothetical protein B0I37DRAFT_137167 [Chaetomium sp. MPI-CAGE-AT-0009]|nr:hypothetical protein B0I37DRAFT_137167 [Chaetomium sp. MPI-CAGE-AT-0009]
MEKRGLTAVLVVCASFINRICLDFLSSVLGHCSSGVKPRAGDDVVPAADCRPWAASHDLSGTRTRSRTLCWLGCKSAKQGNTRLVTTSVSVSVSKEDRDEKTNGSDVIKSCRHYRSGVVHGCQRWRKLRERYKTLPSQALSGPINLRW